MAELTVGGLLVMTDDRGRLHFWGEVFNLSETIQRWVHLTVRLRDAWGGVLQEMSDILALEWTLPGARNPFHIRFLNPPEHWHSHVIELTGQVHDLSDLSQPQPHTGLLVEKLHFREIERADLRCSIIGLLTNKSLAPASHVKVAATLYGPEGKVVGVLSPYLVSQGAFLPGDSLPFEIKFYAVGGVVVNYAVQVQGRIVNDRAL